MMVKMIVDEDRKEAKGHSTQNNKTLKWKDSRRVKYLCMAMAIVIFNQSGYLHPPWCDTKLS